MAVAAAENAVSAEDLAGVPAGAPARDPAPEADAGAVAAALRAVLAQYGLRDLDPQPLGGGAWLVAGTALGLRLEGDGSPGGTPRLLASCDGRTWEPLEALVLQHQAWRQGSAVAPAPAVRNSNSDSARIPSGRMGMDSPALPELGLGQPRMGMDSPVLAPTAVHSLRDLGAEVWPSDTTRSELLRWPAPSRPSGSQRPPASSQEYVRQEAPSSHRHQQEARNAPLDMGLPVWRPDGLPSFNNAFPASFSALSGSSQYYSQFRVRVPMSSQYDLPEH